MDSLVRAFRDLSSRIDLVRDHRFESGQDNGAYFTFAFDTTRPAELWWLIQTSVLRSPTFGGFMSKSMMAMCTGERGWDDYLQLCHWDSAVECDPVPAV
jgi:hypothetical protein